MKQHTVERCCKFMFRKGSFKYTLLILKNETFSFGQTEALVLWNDIFLQIISTTVRWASLFHDGRKMLSKTLEQFIIISRKERIMNVILWLFLYSPEVFFCQTDGNAVTATDYDNEVELGRRKWREEVKIEVGEKKWSECILKWLLFHWEKFGHFIHLCRRYTAEYQFP